jgi:hypothetical protein
MWRFISDFLKSEVIIDTIRFFKSDYLLSLINTSAHNLIGTLIKAKLIPYAFNSGNKVFPDFFSHFSDVYIYRSG